MMSSFTKYKYLLLALYCVSVESALTDYVNKIGQYLGYSSNPDQYEQSDMELIPTIPYEVSSLDEKFISEAIKLTGVAISELDSCQQRVVLKLKSDCNKMNDEQLAKMAVHLLNCQSYVEGRQTYPCTDEMSIKQCTQNMDSDTWTSYHLMSNRARAVCYMVRQTQFRGMAEHTVNRLMEASKTQLVSLSQIATNQENILDLAETTYDSLSNAQKQLNDQQKDMQKAQFHGQLAIEDNIRRLIDEKQLIHNTHHVLIQMTEDVQKKLENSVKMIAEHSSENRLNHKELLEDVATIQEKASDLFAKIDTYSEMLLKQNERFKEQYQYTLKNLNEVNETVHNLVQLIAGTRQALEEKLSWVMNALGGTDDAVERLYIVSSHIGLILILMLASAFLSCRVSTRFAIVAVPPINLLMALYEIEHLSILQLTVALSVYIAVQSMIIWAITYRKPIREAISNNQYHQQVTTKGTSYEETAEEDHNETDHFDAELTPPASRAGYYSPLRSRSRSQTPLLNLNGSFRSNCKAKTRAGAQCKLTSLPGRDFCHRHQLGDSIME